MSLELKGQGGGLAFHDGRSDVFIHAMFGAGDEVAKDTRAAAQHFFDFAGGHFLAGWKLDKGEKGEADGMLVGQLEAHDENGLFMIAKVAAGVDRAGHVHGGGVQCVYPKKEAERVCRSILATFRLAAKDLASLPPKKK